VVLAETARAHKRRCAVAARKRERRIRQTAARVQCDNKADARELRREIAGSAPASELHAKAQRVFEHQPNVPEPTPGCGEAATRDGIWDSVDAKHLRARPKPCERNAQLAEAASKDEDEVALSAREQLSDPTQKHLQLRRTLLTHVAEARGTS
jgi:hypothetical protein|tara:strand:+ start:1141 stop:1599 length:459 start_codon:yes stop_codon:yes gene_type:complete